MKATFRFSNIESTIPVNEFNSVKAALTYSKAEHGTCTVEFDTDVSAWVNEPTEQRDILARENWIEDCYLNMEHHNLTKAIRTSPLETSEENFHTLLPLIARKEIIVPRLDFVNHFNCIVARVRKMGETFEVPMNDKPTDVGHKRIEDFITIIRNEVNELRESISKNERTNTYDVDLVQVADCLGDLVVYVLSEANRWGIPIVAVLHAILDSQDSKLVDGKPLWNEARTKFIKGPHYVAPEPVIEQIIKDAQAEDPMDPVLQEIIEEKNEQFRFEGEDSQ